ncbi:MAG TPA: hypothetical protein P5186_05080 [Candidatus Paceibacterota bacterium]|nr:hypothetical protein [Candidatus Paceibacterota bacterium]
MNNMASMLAMEGDVVRGVGSLGKSAGMLMSDVLLIIGALLALTLFLILIIFISRSSRRSRSAHRKHRHHQIHSSSMPTSKTTDSKAGQSSPEETREVEVSPEDEEAEEATVHHHHHRRRRHRHKHEHRQRNPTLAETGGLPPLRDPNAPPPPLI